MPIEQLPIFCYYDKQRFTQFGAMDCANWYGIHVDSGKKQQALYPAMGRKHISFFNENKLVFDSEPRVIFKTINFFYIVVGTRVIQVDAFFNQKVIGHVNLVGNLWFAFLPVGTEVFALLTDETTIYRIHEVNPSSVTMDAITDPNAPQNPLYVGAFGNRFLVSQKDTPNYFLSTDNLAGTVNDCFTINGQALQNRASGIVRQIGVLHSQLYIFTDYTTDIWANIPTQIVVGNAIDTFPWKLNTSYNFDYGIADPFSLSIDFGRMVWLAKNSSGLTSFVASSGAQPQDISSQAINVLLEQSASIDGLSPFLNQESEGFLYQYENTIFYRVSAGKFLDFGDLDIQNSANAIEYNFATGTWARVIELNGERNRIQKHIYFNNMHIVTVSGDTAMYQMAGNIYHNELRNVNQPNAQAPDAFIKYPMRYELVTKQIYSPDYSERIDDYIEIDFVFGNQTFYKSDTPFNNTNFIVTEESTPEVPIYVVSEDEEAFIITEDGNTPSFDDNHYYALFKPHIELYYSDDGGVTFTSADNREFSPLGQYRWRMRWYELGAYRNRCYKLVGVSSAPIVILGAVASTRRASGGAN
jgi:hypothetical protein